MKLKDGPVIIEKDKDGEKAYDISSKLFKERVILLTGEIDDTTVNEIVPQLLYLDNKSKKDITVYINSPGGSVVDGLAIYDVFKLLRCDIKTICMGQASSMGAFLLAAGTKGKRYALPNSRIMIHQPWGGAMGKVTDLQLQISEAESLKKILDKELGKNCGKSKKEITEATLHDNFMSPEEAIKFGLIDHIVGK